MRVPAALLTISKRNIVLPELEQGNLWTRKPSRQLMMLLSRYSPVGRLQLCQMNDLAEPQRYAAPGKAGDHAGLSPAYPPASATGHSKSSPPLRDSCSATRWPHTKNSVEIERRLSSVASTRTRDHLRVNGVALASEFLADLRSVPGGEAHVDPEPETDRAAAPGAGQV